MLGKTPALAALAAVFTMFAGAVECAAQSDTAAAEAAQAETAKFNAWRDRFRARALKAGIPHDLFEKALGHVRPDPSVHEKNEEQPEFTRPVWDYLDGALSNSRINNGRKMLGLHASLLADAERRWGVPRQFLVAIWGMETSYGALLGNHNVFEALATLSYRGDRTEYGEEQLLAALELLAGGHKPVGAMKGSWAGAVGHTQFVPTTYLKYAVDGDKDGRRDLWDSLSDVFHSTAHYLKKSGFDGNLKWGREAFLPDNFDYTLAGYHVTKPLSEWREQGVRMSNGALVPGLDIKASIIVPAGHQGPAFLIYENFQAILAYNHSTSYALAIGLLSDQLHGGPSLKKSWPRHLKPLRREERVEIQQRLKALGYEVSKVDGVLGRETRSAIQAFQKDQGDIADGYATADLLAKLRAAKPAEMASAEPVAAEGEAAFEENPQAEEVAMFETDGETTGVDSAVDPAEGNNDAQAGSGGAAEAVAEDEAEGEAGGESNSAVAYREDTAPEMAAEEDLPAAIPAEAVDAHLPRAKPADAETETETETEADTPLPRAKPVAVAAEPAPRGQDAGVAALTELQAAPQPKPNFTGVTSALAAPGLMILSNGMATPLPTPKQTAPDASQPGTTANAVPLNNGDELIVSPPGVAYVGTGDEAEKAEAGAGASGDDEAERDAGESGGGSETPDASSDPGS